MSAFDEELDHVVREARERLARRLLVAASVLQGQAKRDYSKSNRAPYTNPAPRGEFPRGRTWNLRDSVAIAPETLSGIIEADMRVRVGILPGAFYGAVLHARGWKGLSDSYDAARPAVDAAIRGA